MNVIFLPKSDNTGNPAPLLPFPVNWPPPSPWKGKQNAWALRLSQHCIARANSPSQGVGMGADAKERGSCERVGSTLSKVLPRGL